MIKRLIVLFFIFHVDFATAQQTPVIVSYVQDSADADAGIKVMQLAYQKLSIPVEFLALSGQDALAASNTGIVNAELQRIDGISAKYTNLIQVPIPINLIQGVAFSKKYRFPVMGWHSLRDYRIGIVKGILFAEQNTKAMNVQSFDDYQTLIQALNDETIDVAVMPRIEGIKALRGMSEQEITEMEGILETMFLYHYVNINNRDLVEKLRPVLKHMLLNGETRKIREDSISGRLILDPS